MYIGSQNNDDGLYGWDVPETWDVEFAIGKNVIAVYGVNWVYHGEAPYQGLIAEVHTGTGSMYITDTTWKVTNDVVAGWTEVDFDDSSWLLAYDEGPYDSIPWVWYDDMIEFSENGARWIWTEPSTWTLLVAYFRKTFYYEPPVPVQESTWGEIKALYE